MPELSKFFDPSCVAVIGASERENSMGGLVLRNLRSSGFERPVYAVNLKEYPAVYGYPCVKTLPEITEPVDLVVICLPLESVSKVFRQMYKVHAKAALILTGGLARQLSQHGRSNQQIAKLAQEFGIRVMGPNCLGVLMPQNKLNASFTHINARHGTSAYVGHSASLGLALLDWAGERDIGFSHFLTLGDSVDVRISDVVDYLAADRRVKAILVHLEQIRDANRLLIALRSASRSKKVLVIHTQSRSSSPNGILDSRRVDSEYFARAGVLQVETIDGLFTGLEILTRARPLKIRNLAIVSNGLGTAVLARQYLLSHGGELATPLDDPDIRKSIWYDSETQGNPVILPPQSGGKEYLKTLTALEKSTDLGAILIIHSPNPRSESTQVANVLLPYVKRSRRLVLTCFLGGLSTQGAHKLFDANNLLNFDSPTDAVNAYLTLAKHADAQEKLRETPASNALEFLPDKKQAERVIYRARKAGRNYLTWSEARNLLRAYGFKLVDSTFDINFNRVLTRLTPRYFPAALRIVHETYSYPFAYQHQPAARWRGAKIELPNDAALKQAQEELIAEKSRRMPDSRILGWAVQPMHRKVDAIQFSLGITREANYGPMIFFGEGGSHAGMLADRHIALAPLNSALARQLIERTQGYEVLKERSDNLERDIFILIGHCIALSQMVIDNPRLMGVEINLVMQNNSDPLVLGVAASLGDKIRPALNPYPTDLEDTVQLKNSKEMLIRPIKAEDELKLRSFFDRFDAESLRLRFFYSRLKFEHIELATMSQIDYQREMVFVAIDADQIQGEMRIWWDINRDELEFAIMVAPEFQGSGLAGQLMVKTFAYAQARGVATIVADVLPENSAMLGLGKRFGFVAHQEEDLIKLIKKMDSQDAV